MISPPRGTSQIGSIFIICLCSESPLTLSLSCREIIDLDPPRTLSGPIGETGTFPLQPGADHE